MANNLGIPSFQTPIVGEQKTLTDVWQRWFSVLSLSIHTTRVLEVELDPASVAASTVMRQTFTVTGLTTNDVVIVNPPALIAGLEVVNARVTATDTLQITFWNTTGAPIDAGVQTYLILAVRK
jgi:hypothetical protein